MRPHSRVFQDLERHGFQFHRSTASLVSEHETSTRLYTINDRISSIQPDNIPIPLGLPIVHGHDDETRISISGLTGDNHKSGFKARSVGKELESETTEGLYPEKYQEGNRYGGLNLSQKQQSDEQIQMRSFSGKKNNNIRSPLEDYDSQDTAAVPPNLPPPKAHSPPVEEPHSPTLEDPEQAVNTNSDEKQTQLEKLNENRKLCTEVEQVKFLSSVERSQKLQELFIIIQKGAIDEMKAFLKAYCCPVELEIIPMFGCAKSYYSEKFNLVNARDQFGNFPLLLSCKMGNCRNQMTIMLLKYGANPNQIDEFNDCPLVYVAQSLSLNPDDQNIAILCELLIYGADIKQAMDTLCDTLETPNKESRTAMMSLTALLKPKFLMLSKDPMKTAHQVSSKLLQVSQVKEEYAIDCNMLASTARDFSYSYLDACRTIWEARRLLFGSKYIENALEENEKRFLSHPFCQEIVLEEFYGNRDYKNLGKKVKLIFKAFSAAFLCPIMFLLLIKDSLMSGSWQYKYSPLDYFSRDLLTPFYSFLCDVTNYAILLGFLVYVSISVPVAFEHAASHSQRSEYQVLEKNTNINVTEIILWLCLLSRVNNELYQWYVKGFKRYFFNFWNYVDVSICVLLLSACGLRLWSISAVSHSADELEVDVLAEEFKRNTLSAVYIYSITQVLVFFRLMNFLDVLNVIGPLQLAVKKMLNDVAKLFILLIIILLGFVSAIHSVANCYIRIQMDQDAEITEFEEFSTFRNTLINLTWSLFDIFGYDALSTKHSWTFAIILLLVLVYSVIGAIIILNTLIAMLNNTYVEIQTNADTEWKFSRCKLFSEYKNGIPWLFPFNIITAPAHILYHLSKDYANRRKTKVKEQLDYDFGLKRYKDLEEHVDPEHTETDGQSQEPQSSLENESALHELKMRYLLINQLANRVDLSKF